LANQALRLGLFRRKAVDILIEQSNERVVVGFRADCVIGQRLATAKTNLLAVDFDLLDLACPNLVEEFRI
jgi:hypothetical protein